MAAHNSPWKIYELVYNFNLSTLARTGGGGTNKNWNIIKLEINIIEIQRVGCGTICQMYSQSTVLAEFVQI